MNHHKQGQQLTDAELGVIVQELYGPLVLYARQLCDAAEDVVQEAFLELQRCWGAEPKTREVAGQDFVSKPASIASHTRAWLFRTVRNKAFDCQRSHRRRAHYEADYSQQRRWFVETTHTALEAAEATEALGHLPEELRETVVARIWGGLTLEQIAELTQVSLATAQRRYVRAMEQLRLRLDDQPQRSKRVQRNQL